MKKRITIIFITLACNVSITFAQILASEQTWQQEDDSLHIYQTISFPFGSLDICPVIQSYNITEQADTSVLELFYNVAGFWPAFFCSRTDTLSFHTSDFENCQLKVIAITYQYSPTDTVSIAYQGDSNLFEICIDNHVISPAVNNDITVVPNPVHKAFTLIHPSGEPIKTVAIYSINGQLKGILSQNISNEESNNFDIAALPAGTYLLQVSTPKHMFSKLLVKL